MSSLVLTILIATCSQLVPRHIKACSNNSHCTIYGDASATCNPVGLGRCVCQQGYSNIAYNSQLYYTCIADTSGVQGMQQLVDVTIWMQYTNSRCTGTDHKSAEPDFSDAMRNLILLPGATETYIATLYCLRNRRIGGVVKARIPLQSIFDKMTILSTTLPEAIRRNTLLLTSLGDVVEGMNASADPNIKLCTETVEEGSCCVPPQVEQNGVCLAPHLVWDPKSSTDDGSLSNGIIAAIVCSICLFIILTVVGLCYHFSKPREGEFDVSIPTDPLPDAETSKNLKSVKSLKSMKETKQI